MRKVHVDKERNLQTVWQYSLGILLFFYSGKNKRGYNCDSGGNSLMPTIDVRPTDAFSCFFFFSFSFAISPKYPQIFRNLSQPLLTFYIICITIYNTNKANDTD